MPAVKNKKIYLAGLTCVSCENIIKEEAQSISGIVRVKASVKTQSAEIEYLGDLPWPELKQKIEKMGYGCALEQSQLQAIKKKSATLEQWFYSVLIVLALYLIYLYFQWIGVLSWLDFNPSDINFGAAFMIGIVASLSSCLAVVGGVVISFAAKYQSRGTAWQRNVEPHLLFHVGRLSSFFILGGALGWLGSKISLSTSFFSWLTILVALVLLWLALNILGLLPSLTKFGLSMPKSSFKIWQKLKNSEHKAAPLLLGAFTFFLPCGFTQSMQLFAISSGNFWLGAFTLFLFALGTAPVLFLVGSTTSRFQHLKSIVFEKAIGLLLLVFALYTLSSGLAVRGIYFGSLFQEKGTAVLNQDDQQVIKMGIDYSGYNPSVFYLKKDVPVKWIIDGTQASGCTNQIIVPDLGIQKSLTKGDNIIEFTPKKTGKINFSCWMGMVRGQFIIE
ncbi:sulfite exporter TauE/SafE family protein [Candidatus Nomurabacteria bacterium]|nr:sulfite exporter TauE/SafE family protein [Candidatus Nomurabacteria bacterium]